MKILALCGSLRSNSANAYLLKAAQKILSQATFINFDISQLPYFDPDNQYSENVPAKVLEFRALAASSDKILISTPEYAHGMPGILKNALEWMFHEGTQKKQAYVIIGSAQGENTLDQLVEVLKTMDFTIDLSQTLLIKGARAKVNSSGDFSDAKAEAEFKKFCAQLN